MTTLHILKPLLDFGAGGVIIAIARQTERGVWVGGGCVCACPCAGFSLCSEKFCESHPVCKWEGTQIR